MAGTIDQLNFEVILDDKEFTAKVKQDIQLASQLNTSLSSLLNVKKQIGKFNKDDVTNNRNAQKILVDNAKTQEQITREKIKTEGVQKRINAQIEKATKGYQTQSRILNELKGYALGYLSIQGASQLLSSLVRVTGEFELQKTTLAAMLGDLNAAEGVITRIQGLAVESPFQFKELTTYAKQLSAFSVPAQELYDTTKMLADISAGLGVGMDRIVLAYGQVRSAAFLRGQEVRQFTEAGIPILDELAKQFTELRGTAVSTAEVFDLISKRMVPFEMVAKVFKDMTSEGGKFYNMQEVQAETLRGKISNLKDAYEVMMNEIGKGQSENLKGAVDMARRLMQNYEDIGKTIKECVIAFGLLRTAVITTAVAMGRLSAANTTVVRLLTSVGRFAMNNPYTLIAAGLTAAGMGIYKWATRLSEAEKIQKSVSETSSDYYKSLATENSKLDSLYAKLKLAEEGTEAYADARKQIYTQYASYISQIDAEKKDITDLIGIYDELKKKIEEAQKAKFREIASQDIEQTYGDTTSKLLGKTERKIKNLGKDLGMSFNEIETQAMIAYATGSLSKEDIQNNPELSRLGDVMAKPIFKAVDNIREAFGEANEAYQNGLVAIDKLYGKADDVTGNNQPFVYNLDDGSGGENPADKVQAEIDAVKRLRDAYETLAPYMNGEMLRKTLTALFPNADQQLIQSLDFRGKLVSLAAELNKFDSEASQKLLDTLSGERASEIASAFKAVETYKNMLDSWLGEDFTLTGTGVNFDISKIIRDLNNQYAKINQKAIQASDLLTKAQMGDEEALKTVREVYGEEVWQEYLTKGEETIERLAELEREEAKKTAAEKIRDLADTYVKDRLKNLDLGDWGDKTLKQVKTIEAEIQRIAGEGVTIDEETINRIKEAGLTLEEFTKMVGDGFEDASEKVDEEIRKKIVEGVVDAMSVMSELGDEIASLGDTIGETGLKELGEDLSRTMNTVSGMMEAFQANDTVALIANVVSYAISSIADVVTQAYEAQQRLFENSLEYRDLMNEIKREVYSGLFGTDELALAAENTRILTDAQREYQNVLEGFERKNFQKNKAMGDTWKQQSIADIIGDVSEAQGWDLYREDGELNIKAIETYFDSFSNSLTRKQRRLVQNLIENGNAVDDAAAQQAEYLTSLFGGVADDIATSMVDAFIESGDAAIDMGNIISDASKQMVADLIKSVYLMPILKGYEEQFKAIDASTPVGSTENTEQKLNLLETALQEISGQSAAITETIERFADYLGTGEGAGTSDLGEGIKGITEDQANLLASYLNAIRADVSYSKTLWVKMDANLQRIADMFTSSPTLMEYQAQIAANTYNTAITTQAILDRLVSVIGSGDDGDAIKIVS